MDSVLKKVVKHPEKIVYGLERKGLLDWLSEKEYIKITYRLAFGRKLNLDDPKALTEKINWYKLYYRDPLMRKCVDKYEVRQYVRESIGDAYLNECFGVWNSIEEIDYNALPNQFVLKPTNGSGDIVICKNKSHFNWEEAKRTLTKYSKRSFATKTKEWAYYDVPFRIIGERLIKSSDENQIKDYKFFCFNGEPEFLFVASDRGTEHLKFDFFDKKWNRLPITNAHEHNMTLNKTTLLIMAAGIGSRFGTGIKQLEPVDDAGHIIMDYSIHDAIEAGFNHVVFIIRKDIEKEFKEVIGDRIASICSSHNVTVDYAFQDINDIPGILPEGRTKPWGTGQAVLAAKKVIKTPFIVINADDYYGKEGFKAVHEYLVNGGKSCMAGFVLKNTLSDNGGVTRGICKMDENGNLTEVVETKNIVKTATGAEADGKVIDVDSLVSMNMWGLTPDFLDVLEEGFKEFFEKEVPDNPLKSEYLIPIFIGELLEQGKMSVKVLRTNDTWYGMTYHEDVVAVKDSFKKMLENGVYKADLFSDL